MAFLENCALSRYQPLPPPPPPTNGQEVTPEEILPEAAWLKVFENLGSMEVVSCMKTSASMLKLVKMARRPEYLTPEVFKHLIEDLEIKDILNCRLVCKVWTKSVDHVMQTLPLKDNLISGSPHDNFHQQFRNMLDVNEFLEAMRDHPGNPFVGRNIVLSDILNGEEFWPAARRLLERFGREVWHADIQYLPNGKDYFKRNLPHIRGLLLLMPNLKTLSMFPSKFRFYPWVKADVDAANAYFKQNPFPRLKYLQDFEEIWNVGPSVANEVLKSCCTKESLKILNLSPHVFDREYEFPNITWLKLNIKKLADLECFRRIRCQPKTLALGYDGDLKDSSTFDLMAVLTALAPFAQSVEELCLGLNVNAEGEETDAMLSYSRVKLLFVKHCSGRLGRFPTFTALQDLRIESSWMPFPIRAFMQFMREDDSEDEEGAGAASDESDEEFTNKLGFNPILFELCTENPEIWSRMGQLQTVECSGRGFDRPRP